MFYYKFIRNILFKFDPEFIHEVTFFFLRFFPKLMSIFMPGLKLQSDRYKVSSNGFDWSFPVGLAAGLDKNAVAINYFDRIGFGAIEVGTVTSKKQDGNPRPRIFRYTDKSSLRNFMGFPNKGMDYLYSKLSTIDSSKEIGVNLGKNSNTPNDMAEYDYVTLYEKFASISDYLVINVSCPNVANLGKMQSSKSLTNLLESLNDVRIKQPTKLLIKIAPDLSVEELKEIVDISNKFNLSGIISTNTIKIPELGDGGISGDLLYEEAHRNRIELLKIARNYPDLEIIGVGGFKNFEQILEFWKSGGKFVQIYTSFIYEGPFVLDYIRKDIDKYLEKYNFNTLQEMFDSGHFL